AHVGVRHFRTPSSWIVDKGDSLALDPIVQVLRLNIIGLIGVAQNIFSEPDRRGLSRLSLIARENLARHGSSIAFYAGERTDGTDCSALKNNRADYCLALARRLRAFRLARAADRSPRFCSDASRGGKSRRPGRATA